MFTAKRLQNTLCQYQYDACLSMSLLGLLKSLKTDFDVKCPTPLKDYNHKLAFL